MKKLFVLFAMVFATVLQSAAYYFTDQVTIGESTYNLDKEAKVARLFTAPSGDTGRFVVPATISYDNEEYTVVEIFYSAFYLAEFEEVEFLGVETKVSVSGCSTVKKVILPEGLKAIASTAFNECTALEDVNLPSSLTEIPLGAFAMCISLKDITIPESITAIQNHAFRECFSMTKIDLPAGLETLGDYVFFGTPLTELNIPEKIDFNGLMLAGCITLHTIDFAASDRYTVKDGSVYSADETALLYCGVNEGTVTVPETVTAIGIGAFFGKNITSVKMPEVTTIGPEAFRESKITSVEFPKLTSIGKNAFQESSLTSVTLPDGLTQIEASAFSGCVNLSEVTLPAGQPSCGIRIFYACRSLTSITIPAGWTDLPAYMFGDCSGLSKVEFAGSLQHIHPFCFYYCSSLEHFDFPEGITAIDFCAFAYSGLKGDIDFPEGITSLGENQEEVDSYGTGNRILMRLPGVTSVTLPSTLKNQINLMPHLGSRPDGFKIINFSEIPYLEVFGLHPADNPSAWSEFSYYAWPSCGWYSEGDYMWNRNDTGHQVDFEPTGELRKDGVTFLLDVTNANYADGVATFEASVPEGFEIGAVTASEGTVSEVAVSRSGEVRQYRIDGVSSFPEVKIEVRYHEYNVAGNVTMDESGEVQIASIDRPTMPEGTSARIVFRDGGIIVSGLAAGQPIAVYDMYGHVVAQTKATGVSQMVASDLGKGVYIVTAGRTAAKVAIR